MAWSTAQSKTSRGERVGRMNGVWNMANFMGQHSCSGWSGSGVATTRIGRSAALELRRRLGGEGRASGEVVVGGEDRAHGERFELGVVALAEQLRALQQRLRETDRERRAGR